MSATEASVWEIAAAAMLHDLGKFAQRAGMEEYRSEPVSVYCPSGPDGRPTRLHAAYTYGTVVALQKAFPPELSPRRVAQIAAEHHAPHSVASRIVCTADRISAGSDRTNEELEAEAARRFYEVPLLSVFGSVKLCGRQEAKATAYALEPLEPEAAFPVAGASVDREAYAALWRRFETEARATACRSPEQFLVALDALLERYTWCIPSTTREDPDISLYDHARTAAAFATALFRYHEERGDLQNEAAVEDRRAKKFLLLGGDLSGIQRYLFDLPSARYNAKVLRARSFELEALCLATARGLLAAARLPEQCLLSSAGGRFLLVLPASPAVKELLEAFRVKLESSMLERYLGELSLNLSGGLPVSAEDLEQRRAGTVFAELRCDLQEARQRKLQTALRTAGHVMSAYYEELAARGPCTCCDKRARAGDGAAEPELCPACASLVRTGRRLLGARYASVAVGGSSGIGGHRLAGGSALHLAERREELPEGVVAASINAFEPGLGLIRSPHHVPRKDDGEVATFEEMAAWAGDSGVPRIAMVKADVDRLGLIFSEGLGGRLSISRYAALSRMLHYFFSSCVQQEIAHRFPRLYTVYSGGDDLCVLGPWQDALQFAMHIEERLRAFTGRTPSITLSAAVCLGPGGLPVRTLAAMAQEDLEKSKAQGRNRITLFSSTVEWERCRELLGIGRRLHELIEQGRLSAGLVHGLIGYGASERRLRNGEVSERTALWRSHFRYAVRRNVDQREVREWLIEIVEREIAHIRVPASLALYLHRRVPQASDRGRSGTSR